MAQGVKLVRLSEGATLVSVSVCEGEEDVKSEESSAVEATTEEVTNVEAVNNDSQVEE
jgi:hypothetical protein